MATRKEKRGAGRPVGTYKKRRFKDTDLGRFIYLHEPLLYKVICPKDTLGYAPDLFLVETVIKCSDNPSFKTERFKNYLQEYREKGLQVNRVKSITKESVSYYSYLRLSRALQHIRDNKKEIEAKERLVRQIIQMAVDRIESD
jgi:hypothetical protein